MHVDIEIMNISQVEFNKDYRKLSRDKNDKKGNQTLYKQMVRQDTICNSSIE